MFLFTSYANSAVELNTSRVIYHSEKTGEDIKVKNNSLQPYLVQSWVDSGKEKKDIPFTSTPPLFRLDPDNESTISVIYTGKNLPEDEESLFWLNVKSIPSVNGEIKNNKLIIAIDHRIKLIYRPETLAGDATSAISHVVWTKVSADTLAVTNNSPYFVTFNELSINSKAVSISLDPDNSTLAPHKTLQYTLHTPLGDHPLIKWRAITDDGSQTEQFNKSL